MVTSSCTSARSSSGTKATIASGSLGSPATDKRETGIDPAAGDVHAGRHVGVAGIDERPVDPVLACLELVERVRLLIDDDDGTAGGGHEVEHPLRGRALDVQRRCASRLLGQRATDVDVRLLFEDRAADAGDGLARPFLGLRLVDGPAGWPRRWP